MRAVHIIFAALISASCAVAGLANDEQAANVARVRQSFDLQVPHAPTPVPVGRERRLAYELHLTSFARDR